MYLPVGIWFIVFVESDLIEQRCVYSKFVIRYNRFDSPPPMKKGKKKKRETRNEKYQTNNDKKKDSLNFEYDSSSKLIRC